MGDFNRDGKADLAVANEDSNTVTILLGNGDGTFTAASASPATANSPVSIAMGDFNGDGIQDLAVVNSSSQLVTILLGNGDGTFKAAPSPSTGGVPFSIVVGDFNGDGKADLAVANNGYDTVTILLGNGDGTFTPATVSPATGVNSWSVADFNGDGISDLAVANSYDGTVSVLLTQPQTATAIGISSEGSGLNEVEASYSGDSNYSPSVSGPIALFGPPRSTTTTLVVTSGGTPVTSVAQGTLVTLTVTVKVGSATVTGGLVNFCDATAKYCADSHLLGSVQLTSAGTAVLKFRPGIGSHSYKAVFLGTNPNAASSSSASALTVTGLYPTTTTITQNGSPGNYTLTAAVVGSVYQYAPASPAGTVSFLDSSNGNSVLATAPLGLNVAGLS